MNLLKVNPLTVKHEMTAERRLGIAKLIIVILMLFLASMTIFTWVNAERQIKRDREIRIQQEQDKATIAFLQDENKLLREELKSLNSRIDKLIATSKKPTVVNHYYYFYEGELIKSESETTEDPKPHLAKPNPFERRDVDDPISWD